LLAIILQAKTDTHAMPTEQRKRSEVNADCRQDYQHGKQHTAPRA
jgi:hypothetical protein